MKDPAEDFTPEQKAVLDEMVREMARAPIGWNGRRDYRHTKRSQTVAAAKLVLLGVNRWTAKKATDAHASRAGRHTSVLAAA